MLFLCIPLDVGCHDLIGQILVLVKFLIHITGTTVFFFVVAVDKDIFAGIDVRSDDHIPQKLFFIDRIVGIRFQHIFLDVGPRQNEMIDSKRDKGDQQRCDEIRPGKSVKTCTTANDSHDLRIICHPGSEENYRDKDQDRHKGQNQVHDPERIKIK